MNSDNYLVVIYKNFHKSCDFHLTYSRKKGSLSWGSEVRHQQGGWQHETTRVGSGCAIQAVPALFFGDPKGSSGIPSAESAPPRGGSAGLHDGELEADMVARATAREGWGLRDGEV
jgi:hypothetical protein